MAGDCVRFRDVVRRKNIFESSRGARVQGGPRLAHCGPVLVTERFAQNSSGASWHSLAFNLLPPRFCCDRSLTRKI